MPGYNFLKKSISFVFTLETKNQNDSMVSLEEIADQRIP